jgi:3-hydroxyisobutyrate dehydrogenase-like beta-hydroxyacid dehydrogenase
MSRIVNVGVIGLGIIGKPIAVRLLQAGFCLAI